MSCGPGGCLGAQLGIGGASERLCHMSICSSELTDIVCVAFLGLEVCGMVALEDFKPTRLLVTLASEDSLCEGGRDFDVGAADAFEVQVVWVFIFFSDTLRLLLFIRGLSKKLSIKNISNTL